MKKMTTAFRDLLRAPGIIHAPIAYDPLIARIAEQAGFRCLDLGGYALGASSCVSEPLLSLEEVLAATRRITAAVAIPLMVDGGAGYGDPLHVIRTVRELERAGAAAVHIEDQVFPKRIHYHKGIEHVIPAEGIRRANLYVEAGADMVMIFPNTPEETRRVPALVRAPLIYVNSEGNRLGQPIFAAQELKAMGYKMVNDAISAIAVAFTSVKELFLRLKATGRTGLDQAVFKGIRKEIEDTIGLEEYYRIEEETVERQE